MPDERTEIAPKPNLLSPENGASFEQAEGGREQPEVHSASAQEAVPSAEAIPAAVRQQLAAATVAAPSKDPILEDVENILAEGLGEVYAALPAAKKTAFKVKGEEVATKIRIMIVQGKLKLHDVWKVIREWLSMVPGINRFFLEQEAKIKTDKIAAYARQSNTNTHS